MTDAERNILVVVHARRDDTVAAAQRVVSALRAAGARPVLSIDDREELGDALALFGPVYTLGGPMPGGLPETQVVVDERTGVLATPGDGAVRATYAYADGSVALDGAPVASDPALGLTLDIGHIVCLEPMSVTECVRRGAPTLAHVHIEDMRRGVHEHLMFGEGELDLDESLRVLSEIGYEGMVAVELSRHWHAAHETVPAAKSALRAAEREAIR